MNGLQKLHRQCLYKLRLYREFAHEDMRSGRSDQATFWRSLARANLRDARDIQNTLAELA